MVASLAGLAGRCTTPYRSYPTPQSHAIDAAITACDGTVPGYEAQCLEAEIQRRKMSSPDIAAAIGCTSNKQCEYEYSFWVVTSFGALEKKGWRRWHVTFDFGRSPVDVRVDAQRGTE